jgi:hypothetical protein
MLRRAPARGVARRTTRRTGRRVMHRRFRRTLLVGGMVALAVGGTAAAIKLSQKDVEEIEDHTGKKAEDLSEEELSVAMDDLGIREQELTDGDIQTIEAGITEDARENTEKTPTYLDELERLGALRTEGIITEDEFQKKKKQILGI